MCHLVDLDGMYAFSFNAHVCLGKFALCMSMLIFVPIYMQFYTVFESFPLCFIISCRVCQLLLLYSVRMGGVEMYFFYEKEGWVEGLACSSVSHL